MDLGLAVTTRAYPGALFFAADGYHHHLATNTWSVRPGSAGASPTAGVDSVQINVPGLATAREVRGPAGILFQLVPG